METIRTYVILCTLLVLAGAAFVVYPVLFDTLNERTLDDSVVNVRQGMAAESEFLLSHARTLDEQRTFDRYIGSRDIANLLSATVQEMRQRDLGGLLVTDGAGTALSRGNAITRRGDFVFHTTAWGRALAQQREVATVERGVAWPLVVIGAMPLVRGGELFGSLVPVYIVNDAYAMEFKKRHLDEDVEVAFHADGRGIVGDSFSDPQRKQILAAYFTDGSDMLRIEGLRRSVHFNGDRYLVQAVALPGVEENIAHALVFTPKATHLVQTLVAATFALAVVAFVGVLVQLAVRPPLFRRTWLLGMLLGISGFVLGTEVYLWYDDLLMSEGASLRSPSSLIYNSTLELNPAVSAFSRAFEQRIGIQLYSGGEAINVVGVVLAFDPELVRVEDIRMERSFCDPNLVIERAIDNEEGVVRFSCGVPSPGFAERSGVVAELVIQPLQEGEFTLRFTEETQVLASDGLATDVLRFATNGSYVSAERVVPDDTPEGEGALLVFSPSHPNHERWYPSRQGAFTWTTQKDAVYRYTLDRSPQTRPTAGSETTDNSATVTIPGDGIFYFHLLARMPNDTEELAHHKVLVDATPPAPPSIKASHDTIAAGEVVRFEFGGEDALSGLQSNFYIKLNEGIFLPVGRQFYTAFLEPGSQTATVRTFDLAGNLRDASLEIDVQ